MIDRFAKINFKKQILEIKSKIGLINSHVLVKFFSTNGIYYYQWNILVLR